MSLAHREGRPSELSTVASLDIRCDDCGRTKRMWPGDLARIASSGTRSLIGLHSRLHCSVCRERGGTGKNISLTPTFRRS